MPATACRIRRTTNQSILNGTETAISFDVEDFDQGNMADLVAQPTRITIATAGIYMVGGWNAWAASTAGDRAIRIMKNGEAQPDAIVMQDSPAPLGAGVEPTRVLNTIWKFAAGDYIELFIVQSSGGALNSLTRAYGPSFWAILLEDG
mgnify:FL=1